MERRADPGLIGCTLREAGARVVLTRNGLLAVPLGQRNVAAQPNACGELADVFRGLFDGGITRLHLGEEHHGVGRVPLHAFACDLDAVRARGRRVGVALRVEQRHARQ